jgi:mRNA-degrading endonuclease toxin of MazEF toxin-antitoxin module
MQQGEIWWADLGAPVARRPVVIVSSRESLRSCPHTVVVARITSRIRETPAEVPLGAEDGLPQTVINTEMLYTIPRSDLVSRIACLSPAKQSRLEEALRYVLGMGEVQSPVPQPAPARLPTTLPRLQVGRPFERRFR